ncbi:hypothetical protein HYALB_00004721 [Hymenoscyphus albidus]|uniref:Uncharacterized protein n=1 Tax=Hymenoscyphus albidus TaxID=595503 RepID=A0A9N9QB61_9HELO|nr:hypothetical protein HYALB_00004721 [Hymenoscyphus albidus]
MEASEALSLVLGALSVSSGVAMLTFDIIFAVTLPQSATLTQPRIESIVSSSLVGVDVAFLLVIIGRQLRYRNGAHYQNGRGRRTTYLLVGIGGALGILSAVSSSMLLGMTNNRLRDIPQDSLIISAKLVTAGFAVWAVYLLSQALFLISMLILVQRKKDVLAESQPYHSEPQQEKFPQMVESTKMPAHTTEQDIDHDQREKSSMESRSAASSGGRSRAGSDAMYSIRSSFSQAVRPITSKTRLIQGGQKSPHRAMSINSTHSNMTDGFDSWDTSAVDAQARHAVEAVSPTQRFLETIPASPTTSRSPSPGFPLDLAPPMKRSRSRSRSPANRQGGRERIRRPRNTSPTDSLSINEAHIHPLFRTDSPTPAPAATPGTIVTAAPNAGTLISDRQSIRSIHRMRSGSLPSCPGGLAHSESLDSIRKKMEREEIERLQAGGERTITPPVPDFILNAGPRKILSGYNLRKKSQPVALQKVGE